MSLSSTRFTLLFISLFLALTAWSQSQTPITGTLLEAESDEPLPYATVVIYGAQDSSMVTNGLTEIDGTFRIPVSPGKYYAAIQFIGFSNQYVPDIEVTAEQKTYALGEIHMRSDATLLQEVEVVGERSQVTFKLDRRVFNVGKDLTGGGNSAADILDRVPSVSVDPEGNVSLRGSGSVRILVNGKPSGLLSAGETEALLRMQGDIIESVEVITNPSARYEAEGEAGIINIILKKNQEKGVNGSFGVRAGYPDNYGASYSLNYRREDFNFFSNFGVDYRRSPGGGNATQQFFDDSGSLTEFYSTTTDQNRGGLGGYIQLGTDWNIDEYSVLTASFLYRAGKDRNEATVTYRDFDENRNLLATTIRDVEETEPEHNIEGSLNFTRTYEQEGREWNTVFKYILDDETELADYVQTDSESTGNLLQRSSNTEDEMNMLFQSDYIHPLGESSKLETGVRAALRTVNNDFLVEENENGIYLPVGGFNDELKYTENIYAAYFILAHEFGDFSMQAGLRGELSDITAALLESEQANDQDYFNLFPSASLAYQLDETQQLQLSYSRRLSRPYFRRLLPFSNFNNPRNNNIGNPNLRPEFSDSYELGYLRYLDKGTLLGGLYYRRTTGVIERLTLPGPSEGTTIEFPVNLATRNSYGFEFNFSYNLTEWWDINTDFNFFRALVDGEFEGTDYSADVYGWTTRTNTQLEVSDNLQFQIAYRYNAPRNTTQGRRLSSASLDFGAALDVMQGKGTITLSSRDLLNTRKRRSIIDLPNYFEESVFQWRQARQVVLSFNYRLNQDNKSAGRGGRGGGDF